MAIPNPRVVPPQPFTRVTRPAGLLPSYSRPPLDPAFRRSRDLTMLLFLLPPVLTTALSERFDPGRRPYVWSEPPTRASFARQPYESAELNDLKDARVCGAITTTAGRIEWLLDAPEEAVGGLNRTYLLLVQMRRLRQLWQELRRRWPKGSLATFTKALG
jgi:hypothetical protein